MPDKIDQLYEALRKDGAATKGRDNFRNYMLAPGDEGVANRKALYEALKADGAVTSATQDEFERRLGISGTQQPTAPPTTTAPNALKQQDAAASGGNKGTVLGGTGNIGNLTGAALGGAIGALAGGGYVMGKDGKVVAQAAPVQQQKQQVKQQPTQQPAQQPTAQAQAQVKAEPQQVKQQPAPQTTVEVQSPTASAPKTMPVAGMGELTEEEWRDLNAYKPKYGSDYRLWTAPVYKNGGITYKTNLDEYIPQAVEKGLKSKDRSQMSKEELLAERAALVNKYANGASGSQETYQDAIELNNIEYELVARDIGFKNYADMRSNQGKANYILYAPILSQQWLDYYAKQGSGAVSPGNNPLFVFGWQPLSEKIKQDQANGVNTQMTADEYLKYLLQDPELENKFYAYCLNKAKISNEGFRSVIDKSLEDFKRALNNGRNPNEIVEDEKGVMARFVTEELDRMDGDFEKELDNWQQRFDAWDNPSSWDMHPLEHYAASTGDNALGMIHTAQNLTADSRKMVEEAMKSGSGFSLSGEVGASVRGIRDTAFNWRTWTFGLSDAEDAIHMRTVAQKYINNKPLNQGEQMLLDAMALKAASDAFFQKYLTTGYKAGATTGEALPFILEMMTGAGEASETAVKSVGVMAKRQGMKLLRRIGMDKIVGKTLAYLEKRIAPAFGKLATSKIGKVGTKALATTEKIGKGVSKAAIRGVGQEVATGMPKVAAGAFEGQAGKVEPRFNEQTGHFEVGGISEVEDAGTAWGKSFKRQFGEYATEYLGDEVLEPIITTVNRLGKRAAGKSLEKLHLKGVVDFFDNLKGGDIYRAVQDFRKQVHYNGSFGEFMEEVANNVYNATFVGDQNFNIRDKEGNFSLHEENSVFNTEDNIDTYVSCKFMSGLFGVANVAGYRTPKYRLREDLKLYDQQGKALFGDGETWDLLKGVVETNDPTEVTKIVKEIVTDDSSYNDWQRQAALDYVGAYIKLKGVEQGEEITQNSSPSDLDDAFDTGYNSDESEAQTITDNYNNSVAALQQVGFQAEAIDQLVTRDQIQTMLDGDLWNDEQKQAAEAYINAKAAFYGMSQRTIDVVDSRVFTEEAGGDGMVHPATLKGEGGAGYIVSGRVLTTADGQIDLDNSDSDIIIVDENGEKRMIDIHEIAELGDILDPSELKQVAANEMLGANSPQGIEVGGRYDVTDEQGVGHEVEVLHDYGNGTVEVRVDGEEDSKPMVKAQLEQMLGIDAAQPGEPPVADTPPGDVPPGDDMDAGSERYSVDPNADEMAMGMAGFSEQDIAATVDYLNGKLGDREYLETVGISADTLDATSDEQIASWVNSIVERASEFITDEAVESGDVRVESDEVPADSGTTLTPTPQPEAADATEVEATTEPMPLLDDGNPNYAGTTPERGRQYIYDESGLDKGEADAYVSANLASAEKDLDKIKKKPPKMGTNLVNYKNEKTDWESRMRGAQAAVDYWNQVKAIEQAREAQAAAERKAADRAVAERAQAEEQQRQAEELAKRQEQSERGAGAVHPAIAEKWNNAPKIEGYKDEVVLANGERVPGTYYLVESGAVTPSHNASREFEKYEGFPVDENGNTINDRDYERDKDAQNITRSIADKYDSRALQTPVIVSKDGVVLSGNGRTMAGELAASNNTDGAYIEHLKNYGRKYGFSPEQVTSMKHPRAVFVPDADMPYTTETFAKFNAQEMKGQSKTEQAVKLGKVVDDATFNQIVRAINDHETLGDFYNNTRAATEAINALRRAGALNEMQYAEMFDGDAVSGTGRQIIENMLIGKAFEGNPDVIRMLTEYKSFRQSVVTALNEISTNVALGKDYSLENELAQAIELAYKARKAGFKENELVSPYATQLNLFPFEDGETVADYNNAAVLLLADMLNDKRPTLLKKKLQDYNQQSAESAAGQMDIFAGGVKEKKEIIKTVLNTLHNGEREETSRSEQRGSVADERGGEASLQEDGAAGQPEQGESNIQGLESYSEDELRVIVEEHVRSAIADADMDAEITGIRFIGSRTTGTARADSDLDVLVEYQGTAREDSLFNVLNDEDNRLVIDGITVDINPITPGKSGTIEEFMRRNAGYKKETTVQEQIALAEQQTETSPTDAQKEAGNYKKGHVKIDGFDISIEQPKGSVRSGVDASGKSWRQTMNNTYGYIRGTEGVDGDHIDVFLSDNLDGWNGTVYVVDQVNNDGSFDEHKVMYGFNSEEEARKAYLSNYEEGWQGLGAITPVSKDEFKKWIDSSHRKTKPFAEYKNVKVEGEQAGTMRQPTGQTVDGDIARFHKETDSSGRTAIDEVNYNADDLVAPLLVDGKKSHIGITHIVPDDIDEPTYTRAYYDYAHLIDPKTNKGWQAVGDKIDEWNASHKKDEQGFDDGDAPQVRFPSVDAALKFAEWFEGEDGHTPPAPLYLRGGAEAGGVLPSAEEVALRDGLVEVLRGAGIEVVTDEAEGQRVLDAANGHVQAMGSRVNKRMAEIDALLKGREMNKLQQAVVDVFSGKKDNVPIDIERANGNRHVIMRQGNEQGAGTKHSVFRHYGTTRGVITADDILLVPEVLTKGIREQDGKRISYSLEKEGVKYTVTTEMSGKGERFTNFFTNKKPNGEEQGTRNTAEQPYNQAERFDGTKLQKVSDNASVEEEKSSEALFEATKEKFGTTNDLREAGYILPDGTMLDFSGRYMVDKGRDTSHLRGRRAVDHRAIHEVGYDQDDNETGFITDMADFIGRGAIRIDANAGTINLSKVPTAKQARVLRMLILRNDGDVSVDFGNGYDSEHYAEYESARATRVLGDIDRYFNEGIKPQGNISFFRTENGEVYGFVRDGKIYIDPRVASAETPVHEYSHLWADALKRANPEAWERLKETILGEKDVLEHVKRLYPELEGDELLGEVFSHYSGKRGAEQLRAEMEREMKNAEDVFAKARVAVVFDKIRRALSRFWEMARDLFAGKTRGLDKLTAEDFADMAMNDLLRGFKPKNKAKNVEAATVKDPFYSNAEKAVEGIKQNKATAEQWKAMLTKAGGIKAGEDKWMGLSEWLDENKGKSLTKDEVLQFVRDNGIQMEEVNYGETSERIPEKIYNDFEEIYNNLEEEDFDSKNEMLEYAWGEYTSTAPDWIREAIYPELYYNGSWDLKVKDNRIMLENNISKGDYPINSTRLDYTTEGLENKREIAFVVDGVEPYQEGDAIHFGPENGGRAVMWVRFGETTDADGNRVLVIDEIQSNRHQDAREKGYKVDETELPEKAESDKATQAFKDYQNSLEEKYGDIDKMTADEARRYNELADEMGYAYNRYMNALVEFKKRNSDAVPAAPFEKNWHEVAMKRMLRLAAEEGFDKVAWTTGEQQAERYDIGTKIDKIKVGTYLYGGKTLRQEITMTGNIYTVIEAENGLVVEGEYKGHTLTELFGKELGNKIAKAENGQVFESNDLRIGGEGMKGFYDNILPRFMDKYGKRWGVKTGTVELPNVEEAGRTMHSVDVTPAMRASVMSGQPMFQKAAPNDNFEDVPGVNKEHDEYVSVKEVEDYLATLPNAYNVHGVVEAHPINSLESLDALKPILDQELYDEIKKRIYHPNVYGCRDSETGMIFVFTHKIWTLNHAEHNWWHENTHGAYDALELADKEECGREAYEWLYKNDHMTQDQYEHYAISQRGSEGTARLIAYIFDTKGVNGILNGTFAGKFDNNEKIAKLAAAIQNYYKYGETREEESRNRLRQTSSSSDGRDAENGIDASGRDKQGTIRPEKGGRTEGEIGSHERGSSIIDEVAEDGVGYGEADDSGISDEELAGYDAEGDIELDKPTLRNWVKNLPTLNKVKRHGDAVSIYDEEDLGNLKGLVSDELYEAVESGLKSPIQRGTCDLDSGFIAIYTGKLKTAFETESTWWHENTHLAFDAIELADKDELGLAALAYVKEHDKSYKNFDRMMRNYRKEQLPGEGACRLIQYIYKNWGAQGIINGDFVGNEKIAKLATAIQNYLFYGETREEETENRLRQSSTDTGGEFAEPRPRIRFDSEQGGEEIQPRGKRGNEEEVEGSRFLKEEGEIDDSGISDEELAGYDAGRYSFAEAATAAMMRLSQDHIEDVDFKSKAIRLFSDNLNDLRKIMSKQRTYDRRTVDSLVRLTRSIMATGFFKDMSAYEVKRLLAAIKKGVGAEDLTPIANNVVDMLVQHQLRESKNMLHKLMQVRGRKVDARGVEVQAGLDIDGQRMMSALKDGMSLGEKGLSTRINDCENRLGSEDEVIRKNAMSEYQGLMLAKEYHDNILSGEEEEIVLRNEKRQEQEKIYDFRREPVLDQDGNAIINQDGSVRTVERKTLKPQFKNNVTDENKQERRRLESTIAAIEKAIRDNRMERVTAYSDFISDVAGDIKASRERAAEWRAEQLKRVEEIHHNANSDLKGVDARTQNREKRYIPLFNPKNAIVRGFLQPLATFEKFMRYFGRSFTFGEGYLFDRYVRGLTDCGDKEWRTKRALHEKLDKKVSELFGVTYYSDLYGIARDKEHPSLKISIWDNGVISEQEIYQDEAAVLYAWSRQQDTEAGFRRMGISEEDMETIKSHLDPKFLKLADWLIDEFYPSFRKELNEVHERMFGAPMAAVDNYFPIVRNKADVKTQEKDISERSVAEKLASVIIKSIIKRTRNAAPLDIHTSIIDLVLSDIEEKAKFIAWTEFYRDLNTLLNYKTFENKVRNMSSMEFGAGKDLWKSFEECCAILTGVYDHHGGKADEIAVNISKGFTAGAIAFRPNTALKQLASLTAFWSDASIENIVKYQTRPFPAWKWAMENLPGFAERWQSRQAGDTRLMDTDVDWKLWRNKYMEAINRLGMTPNAFIDAVTVASGARAVYETKKSRYLEIGYDEERAEKRALQDAANSYESSQQSKNKAYVNVMQIKRTVWAAMRTMFRNASMSYGRRLTTSLQELKKRMTPGYKSENIEAEAKKLMRDGIPEDNAWKEARRRYRFAGLHALFNIFNFGWFTPFFWAPVAGYIWYLLAGGDDEEKEEILKDGVYRTPFYFVEGLTGGNIISDVGTNAAKWYFSEDNDGALDFLRNNNLFSTPIESEMEHFLRDLYKMDETAIWWDVFSLAVQTNLGFKPETFTDGVTAIVDCCDADPETSKEALLLIARVLQVPRSQTDKIYFDELGMTAKDAQKLNAMEMAERYARYKRRRSNPLSYLVHSDKDDEMVKKYRDQFLKDMQERMEKMDDEQLEWNFVEGDTARKKAVTKTYFKARGIKDGYSSGSSGEYAHIYSDSRLYSDMAEDALLQLAKTQAENRGDKEQLKAIDYIKSEILTPVLSGDKTGVGQMKAETLEKLGRYAVLTEMLRNEKRRRENAEGLKGLTGDKDSDEKVLRLYRELRKELLRELGVIQ